jgi:hypothetical protein
MTMDALQALKEASASALSVQAGVVLIAPPRVQPAIWLDTAGRPDVRDLIRVQKTDGEGEVRSFWLYTHTGFFLHCESLRPARATFWVAFPLPRWQEFLDIVAQTSSLVFFPGPPPGWATDAEACATWSPAQCSTEELLLVEGITVEIRHPEFSAMLARWFLL